MTLKEKLNLWVKITGLNPSEEKTSFSIDLSGKLSDYDIKVMDDKIKEVLQIDETGLTAADAKKIRKILSKMQIHSKIFCAEI